MDGFSRVSQHLGQEQTPDSHTHRAAPVLRAPKWRASSGHLSGSASHHCPRPAPGTEHLLTPEPVSDLGNGCVTSGPNHKASFMHSDCPLPSSLALMCTASIPALCRGALHFLGPWVPFPWGVGGVRTVSLVVRYWVRAAVGWEACDSDTTSSDGKGGFCPPSQGSPL